MVATSLGQELKVMMNLLGMLHAVCVERGRVGENVMYVMEGSI